jgi:hypothetical protein
MIEIGQNTVYNLEFAIIMVFPKVFEAKSCVCVRMCVGVCI